MLKGTLASQQMIVPAAPGFPANPVNFDGANDYLTREAGLTGAVDSKLLTWSAWTRRLTTGALQRIFNNSGFVFGMRWNFSDEFRIRAFGVFEFETSPITDNSWHHICGSVDTADVNKAHLFVDDVDDLTVNSHNDALVDLTTPDWTFGARDDGTEPVHMDAAIFLFWIDFYVDLSITANRRNVVTSNGKAVDPADAIAAWGDPIVAFHGATNDWHTNKGTGGGFTENGALTDGTGPVEV